MRADGAGAPGDGVAPWAGEVGGRRRFLAGLGALAGAGAVAAALPARVSALRPGASVFVPIAQQRFADTRNEAIYPYGKLATGIRVDVTGRAGIPHEATAVVLTVTAVNQSGTNYVTVYPAGGTRPDASNLNMGYRGEMAANLATVLLGRVGGVGAVDLYAYDATDMIVDVAGYFLPVAGAVRAGRFVGLRRPVRVVDTRHSGVPGPGQSVEVTVDAAGVPADATSVVINLTTTATFGPGYFTCYGLDRAGPPDASNLNVNVVDETRAAAAVVKLTEAGGRRGFKVFTSAGGNVIVDVTGYYTGPSSPLSEDGLFVPVAPQRILDTRSGPGPVGKLWPGWVVDAPVPADRLGAAIVANVTAVDGRDPGYFTVLPAGTPLVEVSNLNVNSRGQTIANHVITRVSTNGVMVYSQAGAHVLVDMAGWITGQPAFPSVRHVNPPPPSIGPPWRLDVPVIGHSSWVFDGAPYAVVDRGHTWHWEGTGDMGQVAHVGLFAHRTEAGGPYRYMHLIRPGDELFVTTGDGRRYRYRMVRRDITSSATSSILAATRFHPGTTISMIGCSRPDGTPTSLAYRLVVTAELVDWSEV
jgi:hypothetical protein